MVCRRISSTTCATALCSRARMASNSRGSCRKPTQGWVRDAVLLCGVQDGIETSFARWAAASGLRWWLRLRSRLRDRQRWPIDAQDAIDRPDRQILIKDRERLVLVVGGWYPTLRHRLLLLGWLCQT